MERVSTLEEVDRYYDLDELMELHEVLDMKADAESAAWKSK